MAEGQPSTHTPPPQMSLTSDDVARRSFSTGFRGYDQQEVRGFLTRVAAELRLVTDRERDLRRRLEDAAPRPEPTGEPNEEQLVAALGAEAARVLQAAREAAADIRTKAEEHVARLVREAQDEAGRVRTEAEQLLEVRTAEAEAAAEAIRGEATAGAEAEIERARARGKEMVAEAQAVRERVLRDLARRRRAAHQQIEQLRAGRERLLEAYRVVRQTLDEATGELSRAEYEARAAAEAAALRTASEPEPTVDDLEAELAAARDSGLPIVREQSAGPEASPAGADGQPVAEPVNPPVAEPVAEPVDPPVAEPVDPPVAEPVDPPPAEPVADVPEPDPAQPVAPGAESAMEERRSSTLRLLRRRRPQEDPEPRPAAGELPAVDVGDEVEGVRILRPEPDPEPEAEPRIAGEAGAEAEPAPAAEVQPEAEPGAQAEPRAEGEPDVAEEPTAEAPERRGADIDALFARIRADRAEAVAEAEEVLSRAEGQREAAEPAAATDAGDDLPAEARQPSDHDLGGRAAAVESALEQRDQRIEPLERRGTRALKRAVADDQNEVLDHLRRHRGALTMDVLLLPPAEHAQRYAAALRDVVAGAAREGAAFAGGHGAGGRGPSDGHGPGDGDGTWLDAGIDDVTGQAAGELVAVLRDRVERLVTEAADAADAADTDDTGEGGQQALTERLSAVYRELKTQRAEPIVREAVAASFSRGAYAAVPEGTALRWVVDFDGKPCPDGDDNALAGPVVKGQPFPTGQCHPPAHGGCRCLLVPHSP